jgi:hypothetical protein
MGWFNWNRFRDAALAPITAPIKTTQALMHGQMPTAQSLATGGLLGGDRTIKASPENLASGGLAGGWAGGSSMSPSGGAPGGPGGSGGPFAGGSPMPPSGGAPGGPGASGAPGGGAPAPPQSGGMLPPSAVPPPAAPPPTPAPFAPLEPAGGFMSSGRAFNPEMWHGSGMPNPQSMGTGGFTSQSLLPPPRPAGPGLGPSGAPAAPSGGAPTGTASPFGAPFASHP